MIPICIMLSIDGKHEFPFIPDKTKNLTYLCTWEWNLFGNITSEDVSSHQAIRKRQIRFWRQQRVRRENSLNFHRSIP